MFKVQYGYQDGSWEDGEIVETLESATNIARANSCKAATHGGMARTLDRYHRILEVYSNGISLWRSTVLDNPAMEVRKKMEQNS